MLTKKKVVTGLILVIGILILINIIASRFFIRFDFTADKEYTLSNASLNILSTLKAPVTVKAYFSGNLPPNIARVKQDFKDLLIEYSNDSHGNVVYDFVDPTESQKTETEAEQNGIRPILINVRERDQIKQQKAYLGAVLKYQGKSEVIPFIQPGSAMEYNISSDIKKMTLKHKTKIAFLQGNGEPSLSSMDQLQQQLSILYDVETVKFNDTTGISNEYKTLVIVAPSDTLNSQDLQQLDNFLKGGGRILIALNRVEGNLQNARGTEVTTGLNNWLKKKGVDVEGEFIVDAHSGNVMVRQQSGMFVMNTPVRFPYLPVITKFADHPITKGIESVLFPFASPIKINNADSSVTITTLATTSNRTGIEKPPVYFDVSRQWTADDFPMSSLPVAVAVQGKIVGGVYSKMVVFGDGDFAVNGEGQSSRKLDADNVNLMANAIDWLSDDTGLIELRTKGVKSRPLNADIEEGTKTFVKYLNFLLPMLLVIGFGIVRNSYRNKKRNKWMMERYVQ